VDINEQGFLRRALELSFLDPNSLERVLKELECMDLFPRVGGTEEGEFILEENGFGTKWLLFWK